MGSRAAAGWTLPSQAPCTGVNGCTSEPRVGAGTPTLMPPGPETFAGSTPCRNPPCASARGRSTMPRHCRSVRGNASLARCRARRRSGPAFPTPSAGRVCFFSTVFFRNRSLGFYQKTNNSPCPRGASKHAPELPGRAGGALAGRGQRLRAQAGSRSGGGDALQTHAPGGRPRVGGPARHTCLEAGGFPELAEQCCRGAAEHCARRRQLHPSSAPRPCPRQAPSP